MVHLRQRYRTDPISYWSKDRRLMFSYWRVRSVKYWHVPCCRWLRRFEVYWLSVPFVVLSKVWPTCGYFTTCSCRHFRSVLDLTEVQPEKLRVRWNPRKGINSVRILHPRSEIRKYETKQNHVRKLRNDSSKWYDWNLKGIRILAFSVRNLRKYEAYLALCTMTNILICSVHV